MPSDAMDSPRPDDRDTIQSGSLEALSREELRGLVREWTLRLREEGLPPERVLAAVKSRVRDAILPRVSRYVDDNAAPRQDRLMTDSSQWCIETLFEPSDQ